MLVKCSKCKEEKPATTDFFPFNKAKRNNLDSWCRSCYSNRKTMERRGKYRAMISDEKLKEILLHFRFCTICGKTEKLNVDHDHERKIIRGLLCNNCNLGLGHFKDDPQLLEFARIYLLSSQEDEESEEYFNQSETLGR